MAISNLIPSTRVHLSSTSELLVIHLATNPVTYICCAYVPPSSTTPDYDNIFLPLHSIPDSAHLILLGDFNITDVNWSTLNASSTSSTSFCDRIFSLNLEQLVNNPTHIRGNTLDLVLSNFPDLISDLTVDTRTCESISDHYLINFHLSTHIPHANTPPRSFLNYSKANFDGLQSYLLKVNLDRCLLQSNVNSIWSLIKEEISTACHLFVPVTWIPKSPFPRWFNAEIRHLINKSHTVRRRLKLRPTNHLRLKLQTLESSLRSLIQASKLKYEQSLISAFSSYPSKLYRHLKSLSNPKSSSYPIIHESKTITNPLIKARLFNSYFNSVFSTSNFVLPPLDQLPTPTNQLSNITINASDVFESLSALNPTKAPGIDGMSPVILKLCAHFLLIPITHLLNTCIQTCSMPDEWKIHKIIPIPKNNNRSDVQNYRPISLLCVLSKVLESIIYDKIADFIYPLLSANQFGFLPNRSCLSQLLSSFSIIVRSIENKDLCDVVYLDFKKAFDSIPHPELLYKLWCHGITGPLWQWFQAYLSKRSHLVSIEGCSSELLPVRSGVPQGSVLGPLLFLIFVNDIPNATSFCTTCLFADDTKLLKPISSKIESTFMQQDLDSLATWCSTWKLSLNTSKCAAMRFSLSPSTSNTYMYSINNHPIKSVDSHKDLGILVTSDLSWSKHINSICSNAYKALHFIRRSISTTSPSLRLRIYLSLVRSKLSFCSQIWRPRLIKDIVCLERVQRRATKFICNDFTSDYKSRLFSLHLLPLMYWLELQDIMFLIRCIKDPPNNLDLNDHISFSSSSTRATSTLSLRHNFSRSSTTRHFYFNRVVHLWNALPTLDLSQSCSSIKKYISNILWNRFLANFDPDSPCTFHLICPCSSCSQTSHTHHFQ